VREALFNILAAIVPDRLFCDVFAGSGIVGLEALSRGASSVVFVERDLRLAQDIERYVRDFGYTQQGTILRSDVYRWGESWPFPPEPVVVFLSPPFSDIQTRPEAMLSLIAQLQERVAPGSSVVLQSEKHSPLDDDPTFTGWDQRKYGRNILLIWTKAEPSAVGSEPTLTPDS